MEIGPEEEAITVEPLEVPSPARETEPAEPVEAPKPERQTVPANLLSEHDAHHEQVPHRRIATITPASRGCFVQPATSRLPRTLTFGQTPSIHS